MRLNLSQASDALSMGRDTIRRKLAEMDITPDASNTYSLRDIIKAVFGDKYAEQLRKLKAEADARELANAERAGELVDFEDYSKHLESLAIHAKQLILDSKLAPGEQDAICNALAALFTGQNAEPGTRNQG